MFKVLVGIVAVGAAIMGLVCLVYGTGAAFGIAASLITGSRRGPRNNRHRDRGAALADRPRIGRGRGTRGYLLYASGLGHRLCSGWVKSFRH